MRALAMLLLLGLCACQAPDAVEPEFRDDTHLVLERKGCLGLCPSYQVHIGPGGNLVFVSHDVTGKHPERNRDGDLVRQYALDYPNRRRLFDLIHSPAYAELEPAYTAGVSDVQTTVLTVTDRNGTRSVTQKGAACLRDRHHPGALQAVSAAGKPAHWVPDVFCEVVDLIDSAGCARYWSAETRPPGDPTDPRLSPPERCRPAKSATGG